MYPKVLEVKPLDDFQILLHFDTGESKIFDVSPYLELKVFSPLKDPSVFKSVKKVFDTVEWSNGADFDPEFLYQESQTLESAPG